MPYFKWRGINISGTDCKGELFAPSDKELDMLLFERGIALLDCKHKPLYRSWYPINRLLVAQFFEQLGLLLHAGIRLPVALTIVAQQHANPRLQEIAFDCAIAVEQGKLLHTALEKNGGVFDVITVNSIRVAQEAGQLTAACTLLQEYIYMQHHFYTQLRSALFMPAITALFLCIVTLGIFGIMIPQFSSILHTLGQEAPPLTQAMISISKMVRSRAVLFIIPLCALVLFFIVRIMRTPPIKKRIDPLLLRLPLVKEVVISRLLVQLCQSLSLLLQAGIPLTSALHLVSESGGNTAFAHVIQQVHEQVNAGTFLHHALREYPHIFPSQMVAMIGVAQESGSLPHMLDMVAQHSQKKVDKALQRLTVLMQPLLMVILGILVALLIIAIYTPIMQIAYKV